MPVARQPGRISKPGDIKTIRRAGRRASGIYSTTWALERVPGDPRPSIGVVASRGFRSAVSRNRAKRRARGCIMDLRELLRPGFCYLVECRSGADEVDYQLLAKDIESTLTRAGAGNR